MTGSISADFPAVAAPGGSSSLPDGPLRGKKSQLWEGGFRAPLIARWPGKIAPGVSDALVCLVDLPATVAALIEKDRAVAATRP